MENSEALLKALMPEEHAKDLPDRFADLNVSPTDVSQYLQRLSIMGLNKLSREADRIADEKSSVIAQTQELAFQEYPTFIETAQCTKDLSKTFRKVGQTTDKLTDNLTNLKEKCVEFSQTAQSLSSAKRLTSLALSRHTQLLEILELPQLMDTCVRNGYWEEALQLSAYVSKLEQKLSHIPLIMNVAQEVQSCNRLMLSHLVGQLRTPAQLPDCLNVVGYLRRMNIFSEEELRLKFLQARNAWFRSTIDEIPKEDAHQHVVKLIQLSRVHLFDIATQYRGIFTDEDLIMLSNQDPFRAIFYSWVVEKIAEFLTSLEVDLQRIPSTIIETVFSQCMSFGLSFGRIGLDFRALAVPLFARVVFNRLELALNKCEARFAESMTNYAVVPVDFEPCPASDLIQPPIALAKYSTLSELCNNFINAFNEFRLWAPVQLLDQVVQKAQQTLISTSKTLAEFHRQMKEAFKPSEEQGFSDLVQLYRNDLIPFIQRVLISLFPAAQIAAQTGYKVAEITKCQLAMMDQEAIIVPIQHLFEEEQKTDENILSVYDNFMELTNMNGESVEQREENTVENSSHVEEEKLVENSEHVEEEKVVENCDHVGEEHDVSEALNQPTTEESTVDSVEPSFISSVQPSEDEKLEVPPSESSTEVQLS